MSLIMNDSIIEKWDKEYKSRQIEVSPCSLLKDYSYLLPVKGLALDLACGLGGNAFYLSAKNLDVHAVDISQVAIDIVNKNALKNEQSIKGITKDIETKGLPNHQYDVIVVSHFLSRELMPEIIDHLREGGLLFYQTWTKAKATKTSPRNPRFLLNKGELLAFCQGMDILHYHEEGLVGDTTQGLRNQAGIIAVR